MINDTIKEHLFGPDLTSTDDNSPHSPESGDEGTLKCTPFILFLVCILGEVLPYMSYISMCCYKGYGVQAVKSRIGSRNQAQLFKRWITLYPLDSAIVCRTAYPLGSDLSHGFLYPAFEQLGPESLNL